MADYLNGLLDQKLPSVKPLKDASKPPKPQTKDEIYGRSPNPRSNSIIDG